MTEQTEKIPWHPGFCGAAELELMKNKEQLEFYPEYNLSKEPLRVDLLVVKKRYDVEIENEIGRIFKRFNILEYKSPEDGLSIDDYYKTVGYACLYKGMGETVNAIPAEELTVSVFRETYPRRMMEELQRSGAEIEERFPGIYYVKGNVLFDTQIVVTGQLAKEYHSSLRILSRNVQEEDIRRFLKESEKEMTPGTRNNISAVLDVSVLANKLVYLKVREEMAMYEGLRELMKDEIMQGEIKGRAKGRAEGRTEGGAKEIIEMGQEFGLDDNSILKRLQEKLNLSLEKATEYLKQYGKAIV
jgi:hypothetical protein